VAAQQNRLNQMRFLLPDPLGNNKHPQMFHSSGFAIAAGVVAVGAAAGSAAISMSAADRAKRGQGKAAASYKKEQRKATAEYEQRQNEVRAMINAVKAPEYNLGAMTGDAAKISEYNRQQVEKFQPGAAALRARSVGQINKAMDVTDQYLRGEIPQDVREQTMRNIAEFGGAGFNPATAGRAGGFQAAQALVPRQFGLTSLGMQERAFAAIPSIQGTAQNWQQLSRAFISEPLDVGKVQLAYQTAAAEVGLQKAGLTSNINTGLYNAKTGLAQNVYNANKENIAASYAAQQAVGEGVGRIGQATAGALTMGMNISAAQQGLNLGGMGGMGGMGGFGTGYGSQPVQFQSRADYASQVSNPSTQYLGGQSRLDTMTDTYSGPRLKDPYS
jgi:hypothetical protein